MAATVTQIAEQIRASLAGASFVVPITVAKRHLPLQDLEELEAARQVSVVPRPGYSAEIESRGNGALVDHEVHVGLQHRPGENETELDQDDELVEQIGDHVRTNLADLTVAGNSVHLVGIEAAPPPHELLRSQGNFTTALVLTYREARA